MTETPATNTYTSVISQESVCIALTLAVLNDLELKTADIENAYLTAPVSEKIWCVLGPEFGADAGECAVVVSSLYGLKSAGTALCTKRGIQKESWCGCEC
jgi:hypothetical protein